MNDYLCESLSAAWSELVEIKKEYKSGAIAFNCKYLDLIEQTIDFFRRTVAKEEEKWGNLLVPLMSAFSADDQSPDKSEGYIFTVMRILTRETVSFILSQDVYDNDADPQKETLVFLPLEFDVDGSPAFYNFRKKNYEDLLDFAGRINRKFNARWDMINPSQRAIMRENAILTQRRIEMEKE